MTWFSITSHIVRSNDEVNVNVNVNPYMFMDNVGLVRRYHDGKINNCMGCSPIVYVFRVLPMCSMKTSTYVHMNMSGNKNPTPERTNLLITNTLSCIEDSIVCLINHNFWWAFHCNITPPNNLHDPKNLRWRNRSNGAAQSAVAADSCQWQRMTAVQQC